MTGPRIYKSPAAFKVALEDRLRRRATERHVMVNRTRQRFVMERFLARAADAFGDAVTLKGGLAMELRFANARSTKDIDLRATGDLDGVFVRLREAAVIDLGDHLAFTVEPDAEHPDIDEAIYGGRRFRAAAQLAGQAYGSPFGIDVGMGDPMSGERDLLVGEDFLGFIGVAPMRVAVYPMATHIAEKLHAYTRPSRLPGRENSRVRDLPDLAILSGARSFTSVELRSALRTTFSFRATHAVPSEVPPPPASWDRPYRTLASENALPWPAVRDVHAIVAAFLDPVLGGRDGRWKPNDGVWSED